MTKHEKMTEETIEDIDTSEETPEVEEVEVANTPTVEDYNAKVEREKELLKKIQTLEAQKEHFKKKATAKVETKETNTQSSLSREEAILFAKGYDEEEVNLATKLSKLNGISVLEAIEDDYVKQKVEARKQKERSEKAALGASNGGSSFKTEKPIGEMTEAEHEAHFRKVMGG